MDGFNYVVPMDILQLFRTQGHIKEVLDNCANELINLAIENQNNPEWIPPIVYSDRRKTFNIHYNFLIFSLATLADQEEIYFQLKLDQSEKKEAVKTAQLLVMGLFEDNLEIVRRMNTYMMDCSKFRNAKPFPLSRRYYNRIVMKNGGNEKVFSAIPFDGHKVQGLMDEELFLSMRNIATNANLEQIVFGEKQFSDYRNGVSGREPEWVF